eukprot:TRINITY_DN50_c0_g1_i1.p1 TRINITY_DN50_c0_g1~~TRINITY_DN50_c0_g1_i1.p1  ORF type:complete len:613 (+),score=132.95 TRINITY_DN50_c0_g1_i1:38-1840(+)
MADRKAEIEAKKKRLEELRQLREERARRRQERHGSVTPVKDTEVNEFVDQLLADAGASGINLAAAQPAAPQSAQATPVRASAASRFKSRSAATMSVGEIRHEDVAPAEMVTYSKTIQTDPMPELEQRPDEEADQPVIVETVPEQTTDTSMQEDDDDEEEEEVKVTEMPPEEAQNLMNTNDFQDFLDATSRLVERVLSVDYDPLIDYGHTEDTDTDLAPGEAVRKFSTFYDERWCQGRTVTCVDWSPKHPELLAAAYNENPTAPHDPDGLVMIWSTKMPSRPEYRFECQSAVLSCCISPYQPNLVVGGTYSGQIVMWDMRAKRTPIMRSKLGTEGHSYPVYCLDIIGTQNAHSLVSICTDGKVCSWGLDNIDAPLDKALPLQLQPASRTVAATCMSFPAGDSNNFVVGSEEGTVYQASRHGGRAGVQSDGYSMPGYLGPVTGVHCHPSKGSGEFAHLFLSASTDWTVKLWSLSSQDHRSLNVFDYFDDYVYDVQWSPVHPALFASVDGTGQLDFWNLNGDIEVPYASVSVRDDGVALNTLRWNGAGDQLAVGDGHGSLHIYNIGDRLAMPRSDEASKLRDTLNDLQAARADNERPATGSAL